MGGTLRDRCKQILNQINKDAILRQGSSVETLTAFVLSETGRKADPRLEPTAPLVLYFLNKEAREEFVEMTRAANPQWVAKRMP